MKKKIGRNEICPCGSGKRFKNCCGRKQGQSAVARSTNSGLIMAISAVVLIALGALWYNSRSNSNATTTTGNVPQNLPYNSGALPGIAPAASYTEIPGIDLSTLSDLQRKTVLERANRQNCTCGCGYTIAGCRHLDTACGTSLPLAQQIVAQVRAGS